MHQPRHPALLMTLLLCVIGLAAAQPSTNQAPITNVTSSSLPPSNLINVCPELQISGTCTACLQWTDPKYSSAPDPVNQRIHYSRYSVQATNTAGATFNQGFIVTQGVVYSPSNCSALAVGVTATFRVAGQDVYGNIGQYSNIVNVTCLTPSNNNSTTGNKVANGISGLNVVYTRPNFVATLKQGSTKTTKVTLRVRCQLNNNSKIINQQTTGMGNVTKLMLNPGLTKGLSYNCKVNLYVFYFVKNVTVSDVDVRSLTVTG